MLKRESGSPKSPRHTMFQAADAESLEQKLARIKSTLRQGRVFLDPQPKLAQEQSIHQANFEAYLRCFSEEVHRDMARKIVNEYLTYISMQELLDGVQHCVGKLNPLLDNLEYGIITQQYHSQQWVAELALRHLCQLPQHKLEMNHQFICHDGGRSLQRLSCFLMFDDCAYSGSQLATQVLPRFYKSLLAAGNDQKVTLIYAIPFMTKHACTELEKSHQALQQRYAGQVDIDLQLFKFKHINAIADLNIPEEEQELFAEVCGGRYQKLCEMVLTYTAWKRPDAISMSHYIAEGCVPNELSKLTGMRYDQIPKDLRHGPFIPDIEKPYSMNAMYSDAYVKY